MKKEKLNDRQIKGLLKAADILIPGDSELPKFSSTSFIHHLDRILDYTSKQNIEELRALLMMFYYLPKFLVKLILFIAEHSKKLPTVLATPFRLIAIGIKGIVLALYYSGISDDRNLGRHIQNTIQWKIKILHD